MEKIITFFGQKAKVKCDEKCDKAWGRDRPKYYLELGPEKVYGIGCESFWPDIEELKDIDDWAYLPDDKLGIAPLDPGNYEGGHAKPTCESQKMNKWCIRACERCVMSKPGEYNLPLSLPDFSKPFHNYTKKND
ncbi:MAG: hypothetical protein J5I64_13135 [Saprospiraceae bacterium]|nr:hypothetical protein [Saprospiraceae bacterium]